MSRPIKCMYCGAVFSPDPVVTLVRTKKGKKRRTHIECPYCGNGVEREYRPYDKKEEQHDTKTTRGTTTES